MEGKSSSGSQVACEIDKVSNEIGLIAYNVGGANHNCFEGKSPFQKARRFPHEVKVVMRQNGANKDPPETGSKKEHGTGVLTHLSTLKTMPYSCSHRVIPFFGPMLADVCWTRMSKLTESLMK